jgi:hypothetical protein
MPFQVYQQEWEVEGTRRAGYTTAGRISCAFSLSSSSASDMYQRLHLPLIVPNYRDLYKLE